MALISFLITFMCMLLSSQVHSVAIRVRDNACTACLATIEKAVTIPDILSCSVSDDQKKTIMHQQVCSTLTATPLFGFCEEDVNAWSPGLYQYLAGTSQDPQNVCAYFKAC